MYTSWKFERWANICTCKSVWFTGERSMIYNGNPSISWFLKKCGVGHDPEEGFRPSNKSPLSYLQSRLCLTFFCFIWMNQRKIRQQICSWWQWQNPIRHTHSKIYMLELHSQVLIVGLYIQSGSTRLDSPAMYALFPCFCVMIGTSGQNWIIFLFSMIFYKLHISKIQKHEQNTNI